MLCYEIFSGIVSCPTDPHHKLSKILSVFVTFDHHVEQSLSCADTNIYNFFKCNMSRLFTESAMYLSYWSVQLFETYKVTKSQL